MKFKPEGLATGIGSLPYTDPRPALSLIFKSMPEIPHWPQMPQKGSSEGFVFQFLTPLVKMGLLKFKNGSAYFETESDRWAENLAEFYTIYMSAVEGDMAALDNFSLPEDAASGFYAFINSIEENGPGEAILFKGHLAGPLTIGFQLKDERGRLAYYEDQLRDLLVKTLALHARWQAVKLSSLGRPTIIFVDEPGISIYGKSGYITVTREMIKKDLNEIFEQIHAAGGLAGVHSCDAIDWTILYECDTDIVNPDIFNYGDSLLPYARELKAFIARGGILAQGIVPTNEDAFKEDKESLLKRLQNLWAELKARGGIEEQELLAGTIICPACGTGLLEPELAVRIYSLTREVSQVIRKLALR
ncbi:MAG: uroporphyrinogen decarboxylase/cobalamine-independent methonine synthase family protein [Desulfocucumaceae bacterium]